MSAVKKFIGLYLVCFLFFGLAVEVCVFKGPCARIDFQSNETVFDRFGGFVEARTAGRPNLRVAGALLGIGLGKFFEGLTALVYHHPERSALFEGTPWPSDPLYSQLAEGLMLLLPTALAFTLVVLSPFLAIALLWFQSLWARLLFLGVSLGAILGWHPTFLTVFFKTMEMFVDWPRAYFLFSTGLPPHDLGAVCALGLMAIYIARRPEKPWWELVAITLLLQVTNEHLGFEFGVALAIFAAFENRHLPWKPRMRNIMRPLVIVGFTTVVAATIIAILFYARGSKLDEFCTGIDCARYNFESLAHFKFIVACGLTLLIPAAVIGGVVGLFCAVLPSESREADRITNDTVAAGALVIGFLLAAGIGLWMVPYPSSMGRQLAALTVALTIASVRGMQLVGTMWIHGGKFQRRRV